MRNKMRLCYAIFLFMVQIYVGMTMDDQDQIAPGQVSKNRILHHLVNGFPNALDEIVAHFMNDPLVVNSSPEQSLRILQDLVGFSMNYGYTPDDVVNVEIDFSQYKFDQNLNFNFAPLNLQQNTHGKYWKQTSKTPGENKLKLFIHQCARKVTVEAPFMRQVTNQPLRILFEYESLGYQATPMTNISHVYLHIPQPVQDHFYHPQQGHVFSFTPTIISELNFVSLGAIGTIGIEVQEKVTSQMLPLIILPNMPKAEEEKATDEVVQRFEFLGGSTTELIEIDYFYINSNTDQRIPASPFRNPEMIRQLLFSNVNVVSFNFGVFTNLVHLTFQGCFIAWNQPQSFLFPEFAIPQVQITFFARNINQPILIPATMNIDCLTFTNATYLNKVGGLLHPTLTIHGRVKHIIFNHDTGILLSQLRGTPKLPTTLESISLNITPTMSEQLLRQIFLKLCRSTPNILKMGFTEFDLRSGELQCMNIYSPIVEQMLGCVRSYESQYIIRFINEE